MAVLKRIWLACLLAIAGSGPLPLWLHEIVYHGPSGHAVHCGGSSHGQDGACSSASSHSHPASCAHHAHAGHYVHVAYGCDLHDSVPSAALAARMAVDTQQRVLRISSSGSSHDDCAVCFFLSQQTVASSIGSAVQSATLVAVAAPATDRLAAFDVATAYSSRAPPVI